MIDLSDKVFVITGASSGIGRECAITSARLGATLVLFGRDAERLAETRSRCQNPDAHVVACLDLREYERVDAVLQDSHQRVGPFDGIVHAAGASKTLPLAATQASDIDSLFSINVTSGVNLTKHAIKRRYWNPNGGSVVFISSVMGVVGEKGKTTYALTKSALLGGARSLALELASRRIRVNAVSPGVVETPLSDAAVYSQTPEARKAITDLHPLGLGDPADVANAVVFLLSEQSRWITGTNLIVDGGYCAR
jgi:NAD(P)-dependent dehydrogenase (short-subunit alcohol dehydrogenase family)